MNTAEVIDETVFCGITRCALALSCRILVFGRKAKSSDGVRPMRCASMARYARHNVPRHIKLAACSIFHDQINEMGGRSLSFPAFRRIQTSFGFLEEA